MSQFWKFFQPLIPQTFSHLTENNFIFLFLAGGFGGGGSNEMTVGSLSSTSENLVSNFSSFYVAFGKLSFFFF